MNFLRTIRLSLPLFGLLLAAQVASPSNNPGNSTKPNNPTESGPRLSKELKGQLNVHPGQSLKLSTDLGNVRVHTGGTNALTYHILLEADASDKDAAQLLKRFDVTTKEITDGVKMHGQILGKGCTGRLWVTFDITLPKNFNVDVTTGGGNIEIPDVDGRVSLTTTGGNVTTGSITGSARIQTDGGHIITKNISQDLTAITGGGHIFVGDIQGEANLHTGGGHIRVESIAGTARVFTGGGNVSVGKSGSQLYADTAGGQIEVGEAFSLVRARTGGGGIRVVRAGGPTQLQSTNGSIYLTQINSAIRASTDAGEITAWFGPDAKLPGGCNLESNHGDIIVYIPKMLPITIDASVQSDNHHELFVDPSFPLKVTYDQKSTVHAEGALNGGGETLRLHTDQGSIKLMVMDANRQVQMYKQQMEQLKRKLAELQTMNLNMDFSNTMPSPDK
jgi:DUF4097 and DUF4098 domain-containing protein YvlB